MHPNEKYPGVSRFALGAAALYLIGKAFLPEAAVAAGTPASPIEHFVVIFQENVSFDHYFGTYPTALNARVSLPSRPRRARPRSTDSGR